MKKKICAAEWSLDRYEVIPELKYKKDDSTIKHLSGPSFWSTRKLSDVEDGESFTYFVEFEILKCDEIEYEVIETDKNIKFRYYLKSKKDQLNFEDEE